MRSTPACIPCYLRQALSAVREVTDDTDTQRRVLNAAAQILPDLPLENTPSRNTTHVLWRVQELLGCSDPFAGKKRHYNQLALRMYPQLSSLVENSANRLSTALRVAAAGNIIDLGIVGRTDVDVATVLHQVVSEGFAIDDWEFLDGRIADSRGILYLVDNAGETVFDRVLLEELAARGAKITVAVKGEPILNDATMEDALVAGLDEIAQLVSNGSPMCGTDLETCSEEFLRLFEEADLVVSKGQGNFETLNETSRPIFFVLKVKCPEVAREIGVATGDMVATFTPNASRWSA